MLLFLLTNGSDFEENLLSKIISLFFQENFLSKIIKVLKISVSSVAEDYVYSQTYINLAPCLKWLVFKFLICFLPKTL